MPNKFTSFGKRNSNDGKPNRAEKFLARLPNDQRQSILEMMHDDKIRLDDPMFLALAMMAEAKESIIPLPGKLEEIQRNLTLFNTRIESNLVQLTEATESLPEEQTSSARPLSLTTLWNACYLSSFAGMLTGALFIVALDKLFS